MVTTFDLLRHGACSWPAGFYGTSDNPLAAKGMQQMLATANAYGLDYDRLYSSPLSRCADFAQHWGSRHDLPVHEDALLIEGDLGEWEGVSVEHLENELPERLQKFWRDPLGNAPQGAETLKEMQTRIQMFISQAIEQHTGERLLLVSHSGLIRAFIIDLLDAGSSSWRILSIPHGGLTRVCYYHEEGKPDWPLLEFHGKAAL